LSEMDLEIKQYNKIRQQKRRILKNKRKDINNMTLEQNFQLKKALELAEPIIAGNREPEVLSDYNDILGTILEQNNTLRGLQRRFEEVEEDIRSVDNTIILLVRQQRLQKRLTKLKKLLPKPAAAAAAAAAGQ